MGKWGKVDYREWKKLEKRLEQLSEVDMDQLCRQAAQEIARILWNKVKKRTPAMSGNLRREWHVLPVEKHGDTYEITVINNLDYASYVEYGHRQTPGRYVPALGKSLKVSWVKGRFMLTISEQEVKTLAPELLNNMLYEALKGVFDT